MPLKTVLDFPKASQCSVSTQGTEVGKWTVHWLFTRLQYNVAIVSQTTTIKPKSSQPTFFTWLDKENKRTSNWPILSQVPSAEGRLSWQNLILYGISRQRWEMFPVMPSKGPECEIFIPVTLSPIYVQPLGSHPFPKYIIKQQKPPQQVRLMPGMRQFLLVFLTRLCPGWKLDFLFFLPPHSQR